MTATDNAPAVGRGDSKLCVAFRAALIVAVGRSLYSSRGYYCLCCCQYYTAGGKWCKNNANVNDDIELLTQVDGYLAPLFFPFLFFIYS